jgi:tetratricopeptide (TPR) repeat protein
LQTRFEQTGTLADLNEAVTITEQALSAIPADHPRRSSYLSDLSGVLRTQFEQTGMLADLDRAVQLGHEAVNVTAADYPGRARYASNLGSALHVRYLRTGAVGDLDQAVTILEQAVAAAPADSPEHAVMLSNLAGALRVRFERKGTSEDLDQAVMSLEQAVAALPIGDIRRAIFLSNLGGALQVRFKRTAAQADLDEAVRIGREAVAATPADHPECAKSLFNLGSALRTRFERKGTLDDMDEAIEVFAAAVEVAAAPSLRISAARAGSRLAVDRQPHLAANLLERAVRLLPEVAPRQLPRDDQEYALGGLSGLAADAAALALSDPSKQPSDQATLALQLLEGGRAFLFSQALEIRSDLTDLTRQHPKLAARFTRLRGLLDQSTGVESPTAVPIDASSEKIISGNERTTADRRQLAEELSMVLENIRAQKGFNSFGRPPSQVELLQQAVYGPIVAINVSSYRCDALLLTENGVESLPLPDLPMNTAVAQVNAFHQALHGFTRGRNPAERITAQSQMNQILQWLWDAAAGPILDTLGYISQPASGSPWPQVWWAPGGPMGLLPLHAAGYHADPLDEPCRRTVIDRVISSYTATITALRHARRPPGLDSAPDVPVGTQPALIVAMPTTPGLPGQGRLPFVRDEARMIAARIPSSIIYIEPDQLTDGQAIGLGEQTITPTRDAVLAKLVTCAVAHFACHGVNDPVDPSSSRLLLHDHQIAPFTVANLTPLHLDHLRLAFLSACETALTTKTELIDEAIHLATAFQLAGFPHVIGTLWAIDDRMAAQIADAFYAILAAGTSQTPALDVSKAAYALHQAIRAVRDAFPATPFLWAAHIHIGA